MQECINDCVGEYCLYNWTDEQGVLQHTPCSQVDECKEFEECSYTECTDRAQQKKCWVQDCQNECLGTDICVTWIMIDEEWYGQACPSSQETSKEPSSMQEALLHTAKAQLSGFNSTIAAAEKYLCPNGDCESAESMNEAQSYLSQLAQ